jgi:hypothetical protein
MEIANTDLMFQTATYWAPPERDGYGNPVSFPDPVLIACRWEARVEVHQDEGARQYRSRARVFPDRILVRGGWLARGDRRDVADPYANADAIEAHEIRETRQTPDLSGALQEVVVWL